MAEEIRRAEAMKELGIGPRQFDRRKRLAGVLGQKKTLIGRLKIGVYSREDMKKLHGAKRGAGRPIQKKEA